jgi:outer membrane biosynthesis protein TonB
MINSEINSDSVLSPNERIIVAIVAVIIHIFFAIILFVRPVWERPIPAPEPAGITMVSFGNVVTPTETPAPSQSEFTPPITETEQVEETQEVQDITPQKQTQTPDIQTTKNDNTVSVPDKKKDKKEEIVEKKEETNKQEKDKKEKKEESITPAKEDKKNDAISNSNEDRDSKTKDKQGNSDDINDIGKIGVKDGAEISVVGWRWVTKPQPNDALNEQGIIILDITIDQNGNVTKVDLVEKSKSIAIGTYTAYKIAVLNTKFERTLSKPATESTVGRLTFNIKVGN